MRGEIEREIENEISGIKIFQREEKSLSIDNFNKILN